MHSAGSLSRQVCQMEIRHLHSPQRLSARPSSSHLLVAMHSLRNDKFKKIFYMSFCDLSQATHFYIVNYDDRVSIVKK